MDVVTLGMLTLDDLVFPKSDGDDIEYRELLGGAGTFAVLGARIVAGQEGAQRIGWIVHEGSDFPAEVKQQINSWNLRTRYLRTPERLTTRAENRYEGEERFFNFKNPKIQVTADMLDDDQLQAKTFHIISTPDRCMGLVDTILELRQRRFGSPSSGESSPRPLFVWEPMEHSCKPSQLMDFARAMMLVDVFSPNLMEFANLVGGLDLPADDMLPVEDLRHQSFQFLGKCKVQAIVVRLGGEGVYVASSSPIRHDIWMPAYFEPQHGETHPSVVDVTGGGNAFLGAYCYALAHDRDKWDLDIPSTLNDHEVAAVFGSAAASFAVQQFGMPSLAKTEGDAEEAWGQPAQQLSPRIRDLVSQIQDLRWFPEKRVLWVRRDE